MTTRPVTLPSASFPTGEISSPASLPGNVIFKEFNTARPQPLPGTTQLSALLESFSDDAELQAAMTESRKTLSHELYGNDSESLSTLRLRAGLSQRQLADRAGTSQSYIARIEAGTLDPGTDTVSRLAAAMNVDEKAAFGAIRYQRQRGSCNEQ